MTLPAIRRCAVYTRKSSEQGLEQDFNSLDAQREAALAYIASQKHDGWKPVATHYDDGGWSGGNLDRPALKNLLADIELGKINIVVVYKVDRLTRSLADFAKLIEIFDRKGVSFVSVTQQFNTTTSMGRLTLNVLLSFAQFEREVTGERIRDKVLASKKKGIFMGGNPPLGYDIGNRRLNVNEAEAEQVRQIFRLYLELRCVGRLRDALSRRGMRSKAWVSSTGRSVGGSEFSKGALYHLLKNRVYLGETCHKGKIYPGEHEAIVTRELFDAVQQVLEENRLSHRSNKNARSPSLLRGLIEDPQGRPMTPSHTNKHGQRYRYYVSAVEPGSERAKAGRVLRLPATEIETVVIQELRRLVADTSGLIAHLRLAQTDIEVQNKVAAAAGRLDAKLAEGGLSAGEVIQQIVHRIRAGSSKAELEVDREALGRALEVDVLGTASGQSLTSASEGDPERIVIKTDIQLQRHSARTRVLLPAGYDGSKRPSLNAVLIKGIARAYAWRAEMESAGLTVQEVAERAGLSRTLVSQQIALAYLAPDVVEKILDGRQPRSQQLELLAANLPLEWRQQRQWLFGDRE